MHKVINIKNYREPILRKDSGIRVLRQDQRALLVDAESGKIALCDWCDIAEFIDPHASNVFPVSHMRAMEELNLESLFPKAPKESAAVTPASLIIIKMTTYCPLRCTYCYDYTEENTQKIDTDALLVVIKQALQIANKELTLLFHGGEPMVEFRSIEKIVNASKILALEAGKKINFQTQTSGSVLNDRILEFLAKNRFSVGLSLDGPPAMNDVIRIMPDGKGSSRLIERQLQRYRPFFLKYCTILTTVSSVNVANLAGVVRHFRDYGFRAIDFSLFSELGKGACEQSLSFEPAAYIEAMKNIIADAESGELDTIDVAALTRLLDKLLLPESRQYCRPTDGACGAANGVVNVQANGEVTGCDLLRGPAYVMGHIKHDTLQQCLNSPQADYTRSRYDGLLQCHQCTWKHACGGTCGASSPSHTELDSMECMVMQSLFEHIAWRVHESDRLLNYYLKHRKMLNAAEGEYAVV